VNNEIALYTPFIKEIKDLIYRHQYEAMKKVNIELLSLYWKIGHRIELRQREQGWGKSVAEVLSKELQKEFPGNRGYSTRNLWLMRSFYLEYSNLETSILEMMNANLQSSIAEISDTKKIVEIPQLPPLLATVSWTKNIVIMQKCKDYLERIFYIKAAHRFGWTADELTHNIDVKAYERYLKNQTNFDDTEIEDDAE
jgi:predicted nuclease of restriction endonuclease-like (RecB) superfamily